MPARQRAVGIPEELGVVVSVKVDVARGHDHPVGVQHFVGVGNPKAADFGDLPVLDAHVSP